MVRAARRGQPRRPPEVRRPVRVRARRRRGPGAEGGGRPVRGRPRRQLGGGRARARGHPGHPPRPRLGASPSSPGTTRRRGGPIVDALPPGAGTARRAHGAAQRARDRGRAGRARLGGAHAVRAAPGRVDARARSRGRARWTSSARPRSPRRRRTRPGTLVIGEVVSLGAALAAVEAPPGERGRRVGARRVKEVPRGSRRRSARRSAAPGSPSPNEAEIDEFVATLDKFESGEITPDQWRAFRLVRGTYGQRQPEGQMIRVKIPQGVLDGDAARGAGRRGARRTRAASATSPRARTCSSTSCPCTTWSPPCGGWPRPASPRARPAATPSATSPPAPGRACPRTRCST